jgi:cell division protein FtsL
VLYFEQQLESNWGFKMSEKKRFGKRVVIGLSILCFVFFISLIGVVVNYTSVVKSKDETIETKDSQINSLNAQITDLNNQADILKLSKLVKVGLQTSDDRPWLQTPRLHVYGYVCNVGTNAAYDSRLHVVAYQSGGVVAIDTYITLGLIFGESSTSVDTNVFYNGDALTDWSVTPNWTTTP